MALTDKEEARLKDDCQRKLRNSESLPAAERLRLHCLSRGVSGIRSVAVYFRQVDNNRDKKLDFEEFGEAFDLAKIKVNKNSLREAFDSIDADSNGKINFDEFLIALRGPISECRLKLINQAFDIMDADGSGAVTLADVKGKYNARHHPKYQSGEWSEEEVLIHWLKQFGASEDGTITRDDFVNYYIGVSSSIDENNYFDLMMRRAWKI